MTSEQPETEHGTEQEAAAVPEAEPETADAAETGTGTAVPEAEPETEPFEQVRFVEVVITLPTTNPTLVLEEVSPPCRRLSIPIGMPEGVAIAYAARGLRTPKPLTHDLFVATLESLGATVDYVRITAVAHSSFTAELVVSGPRGSRTLPCRPSDGVALALRQRLGAPIMVAPTVLDEVGVFPDWSS